ncbi:alpha/beta hydrolase [Pimelobacter sp. 30-1]|uniref:alpha/beta hydrolase n=1 Tax=Pimelobacter sp. 30-1 TaxID=2004991 RepID=UPI001C0592FE|nr:alpha/beta hydrolase [Pimelobacter sp. 30-1]
MDLRITSEQHLDEGLLERRFTLGDVPGILWTPAGPGPLVLLGHPGGVEAMYPRLLGRAQALSRIGAAAATLELPGSGERPRLPVVDGARADLRTALAAGEPVPADVIDRLILPLVDQAVPELRAAIDALLALPGITGPVACAGGVISIGVRLARVEPRLAAAGLFAGSFVPAAILDEAREVTIPLHVLLQWDDQGNDRQAALDLFDAFGSSEKTLLANLGGHTGVPAHAGEDATRFFARHLGLAR